MNIADDTYNMFNNASTYDDAIGREKELIQITRTLLREMKNNVMLIGNAGIGKKTIVQGLAKRISKNKVRMIDGFVYLDPHEFLFEYISAKDQLTIHLKDSIRKFANTVFFLPDIQGLFQDDKDEIKKLYPLFSIFANRSDLHLICTIDPISYRTYVEKDLFLYKLFEGIRISEASEESSVSIVTSVAKKSNISMSESTAKSIVSLTKRYIYTNFLPAKAVDIVDEAIAKMRIDQHASVTLEDIKEIISDKTGIPITSINASDQERLLYMEDHLGSKVVGQSHAIKTVSDVIRRSRIGLKDPKKPIGSFLFIGGSGVGKTELAKSIATSMYDSENALIRLDMSEYTESHSLQRLIGAPPGYVGYEEGGQLTNPIWEKPYSLLLLDEIEKAHPKVFDVFLQVLDEGRLTDGQGKTVNFNNAIIIATSNAGYADIIDDLIADVDVTDRKFQEETLVPVLMKYFRLEFLNRFDEIIVFKPLKLKDLEQVTRIQLQQLTERLLEKQIILEVGEDLIKKIAKTGKNPLFGARAIKRVIQQKIENSIAKKILSGEIKEGMTIKW